MNYNVRLFPVTTSQKKKMYFHSTKHSLTDRIYILPLTVPLIYKVLGQLFLPITVQFTLTMIRADSADDKLVIFFIFFLENRIRQFA